MDISFTRDEKNELLNRREIGISITFDGATPSRRDILGKVAALLDVSTDCVVLDSLTTQFGSTEAVAQVRVYEDTETRNRIERPYLVQRGMAPEGDAEA
ncbi:MAG: 30S ribosomal protein S24e [Methanomicrobiales archaeon]